MPRFVILEHQWNGVHWDLMLETGENLATWAVDEPIVPDHEQLARPLPPHRRLYLDYEGPISGGRGDVRRFDAGTYEILEWRPDQIRVRLHGAQVKGELVLRASSPDRRDRGAGGWVLRLVGNRS